MGWQLASIVLPCPGPLWLDWANTISTLLFEDITMSMTFSGKVAVVTGAANGIGRATAQAFAAEGLKVVVADMDTAGARARWR
jgi:5,10-methylene-tetrahydrofolate dehydrogenase/methenyl tetrahydrofolate cyclohydrolase